MAILQRRRDTVARVASAARPVSRSHETSRGKTVVASAMSVTMKDRTEAARLAKVRQAWQPEAWVYRRMLGELRYATNYLGNSCMRLRLFPGTYLPGENTPVEINATDKHGLPPDLVDAAVAILQELSNGSPTGSSPLLKALTENFQVAGEGYLLGTPSKSVSGNYDWKIKSISEMVINKDGKIGYRELPGANQADVEWIDTNTTYVSRLWTPDPEWAMLADSPIRGVLDVCEELLLAGRDVRATLRSRIANNGLLLVPDDLAVIGPEPESDDDEEDEFFAALISAAEASLSNEGDASAAVPLIIRGPETGLSAVRHMVLDRPQNKFNVTQRAELISRIATGIDLPAEVLTGKIDLNHWSAWQVDDDTFRHHVEPTAIQQVDSLTIGYLWRRLDEIGTWAPDLVRKIVIWYDPTDLVTHPDRTQDGISLWDRFAISDDTLRRVAGFTTADAPNEDEMLMRIVTKLRTLDPELQAQILNKLDPDLIPPAPKTSEEVPPGSPRDTEQKPAPPEPAPGPPPAGAPETADRLRDALTSALRGADLRARVASLTPVEPTDVPDLRLSRALVDIDRQLRTKLHTAANTSIRRSLDRAGARVVSKARGAQAATVRDIIQGVPLGMVPSTLGTHVLGALGISHEQLLDEKFEEMERQWNRWVSDAQAQAIREVAVAVGVDVAVLTAATSSQNDHHRARGWDWLRNAMIAATAALLASTDDIDDLGTDDLILIGKIRAAVAIAGGFGEGQSSGINADGMPVNPDEMMGQIGTGDTVTELMLQYGLTRDGYEWVWGGSMNAFAPHLALNGTRYTSWSDSVLSTGNDTFPAGGSYYPGDHGGCSCDFMPTIVQTGVLAAS